MTTNAATATTISTRYGQSVSSCSTIATPPTSAAHVIRFTTCAAISVAEAGGEPGALAHEVEDGPPETAAIRPHISE